MNETFEGDRAVLNRHVIEASTAIPVDVEADLVALVARFHRQRRARRLTVLAAGLGAAALLWAVSASLTGSPRRIRATDTTVDGTTPTTPATTAPPAPTGPPPPVAAVLALPECSAVGDLAGWAAAALAPHGNLPTVTTERAVPLADLVASLPVPIRTTATCSRAFGYGAFFAYELRDGDQLVARAAGTPWPSGEVPESVMASAGDSFGGYTIGSGQSLIGGIHGDRLEAIVGTGDAIVGAGVGESYLLVMEYDPALIGDASSPVDRAKMLARLRSSRFATDGWEWEPPREVPAGYVPCSGQYWLEERMVLEYCDAADRTLLLRLGPALPGADLGPLDVGNRAGRLVETGTGRHAVEVEISREFLSAEASTAVAAEDLARLIDSMPLVAAGPVLIDPDGPDYRSSLSEDWASGVLLAAGAETVVPTDDSGAGWLRFTVGLADGKEADAVIQALEPEGFEPGVLGEGTTVEVVSGHDVFVRRGQAVVVCGNVVFNVLGPSTRRQGQDEPFTGVAVDLVAGLLASLDC